MVWQGLRFVWKLLKFSYSSVIFMIFFMIFFMLFPLNVSAQGPPSTINVNGFVFNSDLSGAPNGVVVRVWNVDLDQFFFTQVFAPPIPQLMGAYSLSVNGSVGDLLVVNAYNSSHYGETVEYINNSNMQINVLLYYERPKIILFEPFNESTVLQGFINFTYYLSDISVDSCTLFIGNESLYSNITNSSPLLESNNSFTIFLYEGTYIWNVQCNTSEGYSAFSIYDFYLNVTRPDLEIIPENMWFNYEVLTDSAPATVYANITNSGIFDVIESFFVDFFYGDPENGGVLLDSFLVEGLYSQQSIVLNKSFILNEGFNNIYVVVDSDFDVNETNESNNLANNSVYVEMYSLFYGFVNSNLILGGSEGFLLKNYGALANYSGNVFVANSEASFSIIDLMPIGRYINGSYSYGDFLNIDSALNMTGLPDSINKLWTNDTGVSLQYRNFTLSFGTIYDVPVISNPNSSFITGILWDVSDDAGNGVFDLSDNEDLVFISEIMPNMNGAYGLCDYEIKIPVRLSFYGSNSGMLNLYTEII